MLQMDFSMAPREDGTLAVSMTPPVGISGWSLQFLLQKNFGGISGLIVKSAASGFNNVSGINILDGVQGQFNVKINSVDTSGFSSQNYAYTIARLDSGFVTTLVEGYLLLQPGGFQ